MSFGAVVGSLKPIKEDPEAKYSLVWLFYCSRKEKSRGILV
jgi:hypothetical protein